MVDSIASISIEDMMSASVRSPGTHDCKYLLEGTSIACHYRTTYAPGSVQCHPKHHLVVNIFMRIDHHG